MGHFDPLPHVTDLVKIMIDLYMGKHIDNTWAAPFPLLELLNICTA